VFDQNLIMAKCAALIAFRPSLCKRERERNAKYFPVCVYSNHLCQCVLRLKNTQTFVCTRAKKTKQSLSLAVKQCQSGSERENQKRIQSI
jgi:hypothetical protein